MTPNHSLDAIILGAGAAGLMCAIEAGKRGRRVLLLERADRAGKKILISGGGRCNFTNLHCRPDNFISANPHFAKSALARYPPADFIALVESYGIRYHEKTLGQLFCDDSAKQIVAMLLNECARANVRVVLNTRIGQITREASGFLLKTADATLRSRALVIATGGLSIPKMGATSFGYDVARQFDIPIRDPRPALVPLVLGHSELDAFADLTGVSAEVVASIGKRRFEEKLLFTHRGLSGPAILQISSYWNGEQPVVVDWAPDQKVFADLLASSSGRNLAAARTALRARLAHRLADRLLDLLRPASWTNPSIEDLEKRLHAWPLTPTGTEGYDKA